MILKETLKLFSTGVCDTKEIARRLNTEESAVKGAIITLEQKGFIKKEGCDPNAPKCAGCPMAQLAAELGAYYALTRKGWDYLKKESG